MSVRKKYHAEREGVIDRDSYSLEDTLRLFRNYIGVLTNELYFLESTGYYCEDKGKIVGKWGYDIEIFIFSEIQYKHIWPVTDCYKSYDEDILFTVIEFLFDYVSYPIDKYYHGWNNCGWHATKFNKNEGQAKYRANINKIIENYKDGYTLTEDGEVNILAPTGLKPLIEDNVKTEDPENIDYKINTAISTFSRYDSTLVDKKAAVLELSGVLEYLRDTDIRLRSKDESNLFELMNTFDLRHHNQSQQPKYAKKEWYEWFFYTMLSSIRLLLKLKEEEIAESI